MLCRGVRGAITVSENNREEILQATHELLRDMVEKNGINTEDIASAIFSDTTDLDADYPAKAARELLGWTYVPLFCVSEYCVPGGLARCIRVLLHVNTTKNQQEIRHIYLRGAIGLRQDLLIQED